jgi:hypothetical protein
MAQLPTGMDSGTQTKNGACVKVLFHGNLSTLLAIPETMFQAM